jgi:hypothetical protein
LRPVKASRKNDLKALLKPELGCFREFLCLFLKVNVLVKKLKFDAVTLTNRGGRMPMTTFLLCRKKVVTYFSQSEK